MNAAQSQALRLTTICQEIGAIAESNCHYTEGLSKQIEKTGQAIEALTINELLTLHRQYNNQFNSMYRGES